MILAEVLTALVIGGLFALLFSIVFRATRGFLGFVSVFLLFFLVAWASGLWIRPWGPPLFGVYWLPSIIVTLLLFLLFGAMLPRTPRTRQEAREQIEVKQTAMAAFGFLFWVVLAGLVASVIVGYLT